MIDDGGGNVRSFSCAAPSTNSANSSIAHNITSF